MSPGQIDPVVARQVPAAWARRTLVLPVLRYGDSLIAVMADPAASRHFDELRGLTGAESIDGALASVETLQELIDHVFGGASGEEIDAAEWLATTLLGGATTLGISARGEHAMGWSPEGGARHGLRPGWRQALIGALSSWPEARPGELGEWTALLRAGLDTWRVRCRLIGGTDALEWMARIEERLAQDPATLQAEPELGRQVSRALEAGPLVVRVHSGEAEDEALLTEAIPHLPAALLGGAPRVAHLGGAGCASPVGVVALRTPPEAARIAALSVFTLDALALDWQHVDADAVEAACAAAPLVVCRASAATPTTACDSIDVRLRSEGDSIRWMPVT
jgi:hypothetical protein